MTEINKPLLNSEPEIPTPERPLDDDRMVGLISGAGNHASKLVMLATMHPGVIYGLSGDSSAHNLLKASQVGSDSEGWVPEYTVPFKYLTNSLAPIGMVAKEFIDERKGAIGYQLTDEGEHVGVPLAGYLLDFAERHNLALSQVFGDTTSRNPNERAGGLRWNVFQGLATQLPDERISATELAESVGVDVQRVINSLPELAQIDLVHYEPGTKRLQTYDIDIEGLKERLPRMHLGRSAEIARIVIESNLSACSVAELAEIVTRHDPDENTPAFRNTLKGVLKNWENVGITRRTVEKSGDARVWVTQEQQDRLQELVQILDSIQTTDASVLLRGREMASNIVNDPNRVAKLLEREKQVSVHYQGQENARKRGGRILELLNVTKTEMTYEQIRQELERMGDIVSVQGVKRIIKDRKDVVIVPDQSRRGDRVRLNQD